MTRDLSKVSAIGYLRVSTERQAGELQASLPQQEKDVISLAAKLGCVVGEWFRDEGASGATVEKRPAFSELLESCEAHRRSPSAPGFVLVLNDSRFGRFKNPEESTYWRFHLERLGWLVRFVEGDDVVDVMGRGVMRFVAQAQASQYRQSIVANAKRGAKGAAEQGLWTCEAPFGYRRIVVYPPERSRVLDIGVRKATDEKVSLTPHPIEAAAVVEMFERYATGGESLGRLAEWLRGKGSRVVACRTNVGKILKNPAYLGDVLGGRRRPASNVVSELVSGTYGKPGAHPALVSRDLFDRVQTRLASQQKTIRGAPGKYVLSGLVVCADCGKPYIGGGLGGNHQPTVSNPSGKLWFYKCSSGANKAPYRGHCPGKVGTISQTKLERAVVEAIANEVSRPAAIRALERSIGELLSDKPAATGAELERVRKQRLEAERRRDRLVSALADDLITPTEAGSHIAAVRQDIARLTDRETALRFESSDRKPDHSFGERILSLARDFPSIAARLNGVQLRELIRPWLASATFDKTSRVLTLALRRVPAIAPLVLHTQPARGKQQQSMHGVVVRQIDLSPTGEARRRSASRGR